MKVSPASLGLALLPYAATTLAMAVPHSPGMPTLGPIGQENDYTTVMVTEYTNVTVFETATDTAPAVVTTTTIPAGPPPTTAAPTSSFTENCDYRYCQDGKSICIYWAGYTSWDVSLGPIPGEIPTVIGTC
ncbi:hypothetical protein F5X99DRAFT_410025 [Biscogniauxia marginata]|nr:hypothetical protein F5X99DRAFT_410025 [Biscogniauxia marginata]